MFSPLFTVITKHCLDIYQTNLRYNPDQCHIVVVAIQKLTILVTKICAKTLMITDRTKP
jgi:hypothetical protein